MVGWIGMISAVALPAYQDYVERAQMHQMQR
jgi:Tfp pilus assembly major pilin PilA